MSESNIGSSSAPSPVNDVVEVPVLTGVRNPRGIPQIIFLVSKAYLSMKSKLRFKYK